MKHLLTIFTTFCLAITAISNIVTQECNNEAMTVSNRTVEYYTIRHRGKDLPIYVIRNFFPISLATRWRNELVRSWRKIESKLGHVSLQNLEDFGEWRFTTNNNGIFYEQATNNAKVRSLQDIETRLHVAHRMNQRNFFSYAKWELLPSSQLVAEIRQHMLHADTLSWISNLLDIPMEDFEDTLSDIFVTNYAEHNFLSPHNDGSSGTYAFVASLTARADAAIDVDSSYTNSNCTDSSSPMWESHFGGALEFLCEKETSHPNQQEIQQDHTAVCHRFGPTFNTLIIFPTRLVGLGSGGPMHLVSEVTSSAKEAGFLRFGFTGWWQLKNDAMSENEMRNLHEMRGINT